MSLKSRHTIFSTFPCLATICTIVAFAACSDDDNESAVAGKDASSDSSVLPPAAEEDAGRDGRAPRDSGAGVEGEGLSCAVKTLLQTACWACHGARPANGAPFSLISRDEFMTNSLVEPSKTRLARSIERMKDTNKPMPPRGLPALTAEQIKVFEEWQAQGTPLQSCTAQQGGKCKTCTDMANDYASCTPQAGGMPILCNESAAPNFFICAAQQCNMECGLAMSPGGMAETPCNPANGEACRECLTLKKCREAYEACK
jgi:hypothetical protein